MWLHVPETPPDVREGDITLLSLHSGGAMLDEGVKEGLRFALERRAVTVGYCERQAGTAATLVARMEDAGLDSAPIWDDSGTLPCELWRDRVAVVTAGIPCQPWSGAGARLGVRDPRWLWPHVARALREIRPGLLILENVAGFITPTSLDRDGFAGWSLPAGLGVILGELAEMGWDAEWVCLPASAVGAHHLRWRVFVGAVPRDGGDAWRMRRQGNGRRGPQSGATIAGCSPRADARLPIRRRPAADGRGGPVQGLDAERQASDQSRIHRPPRPHAEGLAGRLHVQQGRPQEPVSDALRDGRQGTDTQRDGRRQGTEGIRARESESAGCSGGPGADERELPQLPFFALPPQECRAWAAVPAWLEPAVEPGFCVDIHGMALVVDEARTLQLRTAGNGVVALQAAVATVALVERLGIGDARRNS